MTAVMGADNTAYIEARDLRVGNVMSSPDGWRVVSSLHQSGPFGIVQIAFEDGGQDAYGWDERARVRLTDDGF